MGGFVVRISPDEWLCGKREMRDPHYQKVEVEVGQLQEHQQGHVEGQHHQYVHKPNAVFDVEHLLHTHTAIFDA